MPLKNFRCNPALDLEVDAPFSAAEWFALTDHQRAEVEATPMFQAEKARMLAFINGDDDALNEKTIQ